MLDALLSDAARLFDIPVDEIISHRRLPHVVEARQAVAFAARQKKVGLREIARALGERHHTTIMYGLRAAAHRAATVPRYAERLARLCGKVTGETSVITIAYDDRGVIRTVCVDGKPYTPDALAEMLVWAEKEKARRLAANRQYNATRRRELRKERTA